MLQSYRASPAPSGRAALPAARRTRRPHSRDTIHNFSQFFGGSFSSVSTPIFTIKSAFCSIFRDLQHDLIEFSKFSKNFGNFYENSGKVHDFSGFSEKFCKFSQNFADFCEILRNFAFFFLFFPCFEPYRSM